MIIGTVKRKGEVSYESKRDRENAHKQVMDKVNVALFPLSGNDFFLHESIEMVSSYNRSNRLRMQNKVRKRQQVQL